MSKLTPEEEQIVAWLRKEADKQLMRAKDMLPGELRTQCERNRLTMLMAALSIERLEHRPKSKEKQ